MNIEYFKSIQNDLEDLIRVRCKWFLLKPNVNDVKHATLQCFLSGILSNWKTRAIKKRKAISLSVFRYIGQNI